MSNFDPIADVKLRALLAQLQAAAADITAANNAIAAARNEVSAARGEISGARAEIFASRDNVNANTNAKTNANIANVNANTNAGLAALSAVNRVWQVFGKADFVTGGNNAEMGTRYIDVPITAVNLAKTVILPGYMMGFSFNNGGWGMSYRLMSSNVVRVMTGENSSMTNYYSFTVLEFK
ncbi:hypothetical protein ACFIQF_11650 [Comamonas sp. J-3]|uniref:hypothetical protein n=1 Tax=Comamonas trifloxystrobinivorans TaxID=3350256 RepID=UPI00372A1EF0